MTVAKLLAPFAPFFADQLYKDLGGALDSVHLDKFPEFNAALVNKDLEERMSIAQRITTIVLSLRKKEGIAVKQPLQTLMIPPVDQAQREAIETVKDIFLQEVNVKEVKFVEGAGILVKKVKCNFRTMGKKFGKDMKAVAAAVAEMTQEQIAELETNGKLQLGSYEILAEDVEIISEDIPGWLVGNDGNLTVALDITLTDELRAEGMARTLVNRIQNIRKKSGLEITDHIRVSIEPNEASTKAVEAFGDYIARQVLADDLKLEANAEKTRYTDEELEEFREIINEKLALAKRDYDQMMSVLMNQDSNDVDDTSPTYKALEEGSTTQSKEELISLAARQQKFIQGLKAALTRIENKTYGIDRITGKLIPKERLRAVPHATLSVESKMAGKK